MSNLDKFLATSLFLLVLFCCCFTTVVLGSPSFEVFFMDDWKCSIYVYPDKEKGEMFAPWCTQYTFNEVKED